MLKSSSVRRCTAQLAAEGAKLPFVKLRVFSSSRFGHCKFLILNILRITPVFAIFCGEKCAPALTNSFAVNILRRSIQKSRERSLQPHEVSDAFELKNNPIVSNILPANALHSIFCRPKIDCKAYISCKFNILRSEIQKHRESFWSQCSSPATL